MNRIMTAHETLLQSRRACLVVLFLLLSGCGTTVKSVLISADNSPTRSADIVGNITDMTWIGDFGIYWEITVEETSTDTASAGISVEDTVESSQQAVTDTATRPRKYRITILETSKLFFRSAETESMYADYGELARGQKVEVWFRGKFIETEPPQISARQLTIIRD